MKCIYYGDCPHNQAICQEDDPFFVCPNRRKLFEMTPIGYELAKEYLQQINEYENFLNNPLSIDGYSLVAEANQFLQKNITQS